MSLKLIEPRKDKGSQSFYVRGTYIGVFVDRSTKTSDKRIARKILKQWETEIEDRKYVDPRAAVTEADASPTTFLAAAVAYMQAGGDRKYVKPILEEWKETDLSKIDQILIDKTAEKLFAGAKPTTKNRQFYTPVSAILKHVGIDKKIKRPKGWQGKKSTSWLADPADAFTLLKAAYKIDPEFGLLCTHLLYTGMRLGEALGLCLNQLRLDRAYCYLPDSKNGDPRGCHIPPYLVKVYREQPPRRAPIEGEHGSAPKDAGVPFLKRAPEKRIFRFTKGERLYDMLDDAMKEAGLSFPPRQGGFHIFCHTYGSWMHQFGQLDTHGLTRTGRWKDTDSADRYVHSTASAEARRADLMPTPNVGKVVELKKKKG